MAVLRFFNIAAVRHLGFVKVRNYASKVRRANIHRQLAKVRASRSNRCGDMTNFLFCQMATVRHIEGLTLDLEDYYPSVLLHCWLGHLTCKIVSEMTYNVSNGTLNPTIPYLAAILYFYKFVISTASTVRRANMTHHGKFRINRSNHCRNMTVFRFFKMAAIRHVGFLNFEILTAVLFGVSMCVIVPNFLQIAQAVAEIWRFRIFF